jgi:hypothetical protein
VGGTTRAYSIAGFAGFKSRCLQYWQISLLWAK